ncbi:MAG: hypothetical protein Q9207_007335 [Kuettlingeria erythrocarpa]
MATEETSGTSSASSLGVIPNRTRQVREASPEPPVSERQSLIEILTGKLDSGADTIEQFLLSLSPHSPFSLWESAQITLPKDKVLDIIKQLSPPEKSKAPQPSDPKLAMVEDELKKYKFYARLGDYAGKVFNDLKSLGYDSEVLVRAAHLSEDLEKDVARGSVSAVTQTVQDAVDMLPQNLQDPDKMPLETAQYAIYTYAMRNKAFHSRAMEFKDGFYWIELGQSIEEDLEDLDDVLPDDQVQHRDKWDHILRYYRDSYIQPDPRHGWVVIPKEERFHPGGPHIPIDVTSLPTLPIGARYIPFNAGHFRDTEEETPKRRLRVASIQDDQFSDSLEGEPLAKKLRLDDFTLEPDGVVVKKEEYDKLFEELLCALQGYRANYPGKAYECVRNQILLVEGDLAMRQEETGLVPQSAKEKKAAGKARKNARRAGRVSESTEGHQGIRDVFKKAIADAGLPSPGSNSNDDTPPPTTDTHPEEKLCHGVSGDVWVDHSDKAVEAIKKFCAQTENPADPSKNNADPSKNIADLPDSVGVFRKQLIDGCDSDAISNRHNYKFGGTSYAGDGWRFEFDALATQVNTVRCDVSYRVVLDKFELRGKNLPGSKSGKDGEGLHEEVKECGAITKWHFGVDVG